MLQHLKRKAEKEGLEDRIQIVKGEASASGLENESVDLAMANSVFHELSSPEAVLKEMLKVLRPGGWVMISDFRDTAITELICRSHGENAHGPFGINELETLLTKARLNNVEVSLVRHWVIGMGKK